MLEACHGGGYQGGEFLAAGEAEFDALAFVGENASTTSWFAVGAGGCPARRGRPDAEVSSRVKMSTRMPGRTGMGRSSSGTPGPRRRQCQVH